MMAKKRVFELAKEIGMPNKDLVAKIKAMGIEVKSHMSSIDGFQVDKIRKEFDLGSSGNIEEKRVTKTVIRRRVKKESDIQPVETESKTVEIPEPEPEIEEKVEEKRKLKGKKGVKKQLRGLKIVTPKEKPKPKIKPKVEEDIKEQTKTKKKEVAKVLGKSSVDTKAQVERPKYQKLKVIPKKLDDESKNLKKDLAKEDKIKRLRERFKPDLSTGTIGDFTTKGFEKVKKRKRREVIDIRDFDRRPRGYRKKKLPKKGNKTEITVPKAIKRVVKMGDVIQVGELARKMSVKAAELLTKLLQMGTAVTITQSIDAETAAIIATDFGFSVERDKEGEDDILKRISQDSSGKEVSRPPVVTVMGHVDHGKTSLLDQIRKTKVTDTEAGGITQSIGAYSVQVKNSKITFVDTPGHEAFTTMRARGAQVTDIVILIVAADDGVMPQTIEAINHAKDAKVPIIVAINKIDKPGANPEKVKQGLTEFGLVPEEWGGENIFVNISAKKGDGISELLDMIILQSEVLDLKVDQEKLMKGIVIESRLDKGKGPIAAIIVQEGTLKVGQPVLAGTKFGKIRAMQDDSGKPVTEAGPSMPVEIQGLSGVPNSGEICYAIDDEKLIKQVSSMRKQKTRDIASEPKPKISLEDLYSQIQQGEIKELKIVIKADTVGSLEALKSSLNKLSTEVVAVKCIHEGVGGVSERDIMLASASNALVIAFNVRSETGATSVAEKENVEVKYYNIIYEVIDNIRKAMEGLLEPEFKEKNLGRAEVKQVFSISKLGTIAGCGVIEGKILRSGKVRLLRDSVVVFEGDISSLKRFKDDAREVLAGQECGIGIENYNDVKVGDLIECYELEEVKPSL